MIAYTLIPGGWFDPFELICSLRERMGLFEPGIPRQLFLREPDGKTHNPELRNWPEIRNLLSRIERFGANAFRPAKEAGAILLEMLDPAVAMPWDQRTEPYWKEHVRIRMALRTNPGVALYGPGGQVVLPQIGQLIACNMTAPNTMVNYGETPAIMLVIDAKPRTPSPSHNHASES